MTRIDRRALFTSGAAAALLAAAGLAPDRQPRPGGRLRIALSREDGSFDAVLAGALYDGLTEIGPDGVLRPELAQGWSARSDARVWEFTLREDVRFHDGAALTAADAAALAARDLPHLAGIAATGRHRLRIALDRPNPHLPYQLAAPGLAITRPARDLAAGLAADPAADPPAGTGAYRPVRLQPGRSFLGRRVEGHYKTGRAGWAEEVELVAISDPRIRAEALRDGFVDVAALPDPGGLAGRGEFRFHPSAEDMAIAARAGVGMPAVIGRRAALDDHRIAERWWIA